MQDINKESIDAVNILDEETNMSLTENLSEEQGESATSLEDTQMSNEELFQKEASDVKVPVSILMNQFRQDLNKIISESSLHIECVLEILRSACTTVEMVAAETANKEMTEYREEIQKIQNKYNIKTDQ